MDPHTRAILAASAFAVMTGRKVAGIHDHAAARHLRIAAECRGDQLQAFDGERSGWFNGTLPDLFDQLGRPFVFIERDGEAVRGYDRTSEGFYTATVSERTVQLFDHAEQAWFAFTIQVA